jgi:hypothetical protein
MTRQKSFKVRVRARMSKTGESYTTARRHLLNRSDPAPAIAPATDVAMLRKLSDATLHQRTGRGLGLPRERAVEACRAPCRRLAGEALVIAVIVGVWHRTTGCARRG